MFNLIFLNTFVTLAKTRSFRGTARAVSITQSAVSQQLRTLENKVGTRLIERTGKQIRLTQSGEIFLNYADNILNTYDEALLSIKTQTEAISGTIKIATIYSIGLYRLQPVIRKFLKKFPHVNIHLEYYHNAIIYEKILNRTVDFGFVAFPKKMKTLVANFLIDDPLVLIQCTQRPIFKKKTVSIADLNGRKFVGLSQTTPTGRELYNIFKKRKIHLEVVNEFENVETLKSAVGVGMGYAIVPKNILVNELRKKTLQVVNLKDISLTRSLGVLSPNNITLTKAKQKFHDMIKNEF